jgi:hypothetical protein
LRNLIWSALEGLDDDLLDPNLPSTVLDEELRSMGLDPDAIAQRGIDFIVKVQEEERLAWQARARERRTQLEAKASRAVVVQGLDRAAVLARLEQLRATHPKLGTAIQMAARKRKPEESTDAELRALLEQMEALRAIEDDDSE